jgi:hypothetical protein
MRLKSLLSSVCIVGTFLSTITDTDAALLTEAALAKFAGVTTARVARTGAVRYIAPSFKGMASRIVWPFMGVQTRATHSKVFEHEFAVATTDISFKQLLDPSNDKEVIISFLNTFVPTFAHNPVKEVEPASIVIPSLPRDGDSSDRKEKATFMDLHVKSKSGASYLVEMQARRHILFDERALFYLCNTYGRQLSEAEMRTKDWYRSLKPTIAVQVLDYDSNRIRGIKDRDMEDMQVKRVREHPLPEGDYIKHYTMKDGHSGQELDHIQMVQVELPRYITRPLFPPKKDFSPVEWWLSILRHSAEYSQDYINTLAAKGIIIPDVVKKGFERLSYHKWNPDMQKEYRLQVEDREEFEAMYAVERTEGKKEGEKTAKIEIAQKMLRRGRPLGEIMEDTGLTTEEIEAIRDGSTS